MKIRSLAKKILPDKVHNGLKKPWRTFSESLARDSLRKAIDEQGLKGLYGRLEKLVPDLRDQYTNFRLDSPYLSTKVRAQHAFQISLVEKVLGLSEIKDRALKIVDVGDSAGTHTQYIKGIFGPERIEALSVNLDREAVKKIREKGLEALCERAEDLSSKHSFDADIFLSFELLEHLMDPFSFLRGLSLKGKAEFLIITVPYLKSSRVGLHQIRNADRRPMNAETTHILELSPQDWQLIFRFSGWLPVFERVYSQYPKRHWLRVAKAYWREFDFEGFYGVVLKKDRSWCDLYKDW